MTFVIYNIVSKHIPGVALNVLFAYQPWLVLNFINKVGR